MDNLLKNNLLLSSTYTITSADTDMEARLRPGALVNLLIQSAISSAEGLGFGFNGLQQKQLFWVLSRITVEVYKPLMWNTSVRVETWPKTIDGLLYIRDFLVYDKHDNCVAKATSGWLAVDLGTKRPKLIEGVEAELFTFLKDKNALTEFPAKLPGVTDGEINEIKSTYFDVDFNRHVTSTRYIDWMFDTLSLDFLRENYPTKLLVNYMKETLPCESIRLQSNKENQNFVFEGTNIARNSVAFRGNIEFNNGSDF